MARILNEQDLRNLEIYGRCEVCHAPREMVTTQHLRATGETNERGWPTFTDEVEKVTRELVCPNGHPQV